MSLCAACAISLVACNQATSSKKADTTTTPTTPVTPTVTVESATIANLAGIWKETQKGDGVYPNELTDYKKSFTYIRETTTTYNSDGTYSEYIKYVYTSKTDTTKSWTTWDSGKGTFSVKDNVLTRIRTDSAYSNSDTVDLTKLTWYSNPNPYTYTKSVIIINGKLCNSAWKRQTTGLGITGTWIEISSQISSGSTPSYKKTEFGIADGKITGYIYSNSTGTFTATDKPSSTFIYSYVLNSDGTLTMSSTDSSTTPWTQTTRVVITGDWLYSGDGATKS